MTPHAIIALHAIMNRIMTDSQRRAVFAKMRDAGGGRQGGPVKPNLPKEGGGRKVLPVKPNLPQQPGGPKTFLPVPGAGPGPNTYDLAVIRNPDGSIGRRYFPEEGSPDLPESTQRVPGYGTDPEDRGKMRTMDWRDKDKDGVDDRDQDGPGMPKYDSPSKARPPAGAGGAQPLPTPPASGNPKMPSPPRTGGPKMPNLPNPPRGYTPGDMQFFTTPPKVGPDGYITGPNGKKYTPETYQQQRDIYERAVASSEERRMKLLSGLDQQTKFGGQKTALGTANTQTPSTNASQPASSTSLSGNTDAAYSDMFQNQTFDTVYKGMLDNNGGKIEEAKKSMLNWLSYMDGWLAEFDTKTGRNNTGGSYAGGQGLSGNLKSDKRTIKKLYSQMRNYMKTITKEK